MDYSNCELVPMTAESAAVLSAWRYPPPYEAYSFSEQDDWLMDASTWGREQFCLTDGHAILAQVACQLYEGAYWVGWSLAPPLCGQGNGHRFVRRCLEELQRLLALTGTLYLRVAASNRRAIAAYRRAGFTYVETIIDEVADSNHPEDFWVMQYTFDIKEHTMSKPLEKMSAFFDARLDGYEEHQLTTIDSAQEFYPLTAACLPAFPNAAVLDLGCGTGLELNHYFALNPAARVTGIDLAPGMLKCLREKFPDKALDLRLGSYFDLPFEENHYDAAVSVESLHHFTQEEKRPLYKKLNAALKSGGAFILTDYFSLSGEEERFHRAELLRLKSEQGISDDEFYHYDTPLTVAHEVEALQAAGFTRVDILHAWGATHLIRAVK